MITYILCIFLGILFYTYFNLKERFNVGGKDIGDNCFNDTDCNDNSGWNRSCNKNCSCKILPGTGEYICVSKNMCVQEDCDDDKFCHNDDTCEEMVTKELLEYKYEFDVESDLMSQDFMALQPWLTDHRLERYEGVISNYANNLVDLIQMLDDEEDGSMRLKQMIDEMEINEDHKVAFREMVKGIPEDLKKNAMEIAIYDIETGGEAYDNENPAVERNWDELTSNELAAARMLGYTKSEWEYAEPTEGPLHRLWINLSPEEQRAAISLGMDRNSFLRRGYRYNFGNPIARKGIFKLYDIKFDSPLPYEEYLEEVDNYLELDNMYTISGNSQSEYALPLISINKDNKFFYLTEDTGRGEIVRGRALLYKGSVTELTQFSTVPLGYGYGEKLMFLLSKARVENESYQDQDLQIKKFHPDWGSEKAYRKLFRLSVGPTWPKKEDEPFSIFKPSKVLMKVLYMVPRPDDTTPEATRIAEDKWNTILDNFDIEPDKENDILYLFLMSLPEKKVQKYLRNYDSTNTVQNKEFRKEYYEFITPRACSASLRSRL